MIVRKKKTANIYLKKKTLFVGVAMNPLSFLCYSNVKCVMRKLFLVISFHLQVEIYASHLVPVLEKITNVFLLNIATLLSKKALNNNKITTLAAIYVQTTFRESHYYTL